MSDTSIILGVIACVIFLLAWPLEVALHEVGHAVPALFLTKGKVAVCVGPANGTMHFKLEIGRWSFEQRGKLFGFPGGHCRIYTAPSGLFSDVLIVLCGPIFPLAFYGGILVYAMEGDLHGAIKLASGLLLVMSVFFETYNLWPRDVSISTDRSEKVHSDGRQLAEFLRMARYRPLLKSAALSIKKGELDKAEAKLTLLLEQKIHEMAALQYLATVFLLKKEWGKMERVEARIKIFGVLDEGWVLR